MGRVRVRLSARQLAIETREKGSWRLRVALKGIDLEVPESLQQMIEFQIDRLSPEEQRMLEVASLESIGLSRFAVASRAAVIDLEPEACVTTLFTEQLEVDVRKNVGCEEKATGTYRAHQKRRACISLNQK